MAVPFLKIGTDGQQEEAVPTINEDLYTPLTKLVGGDITPKDRDELEGFICGFFDNSAEGIAPRVEKHPVILRESFWQYNVNGDLTPTAV